MDIFTYLAKGIQCYECDGLGIPPLGKLCKDNADMGKEKDCGGVFNSCIKGVGSGK